jgi:hypothetical protein
MLSKSVVLLLFLGFGSFMLEIIELIPEGEAMVHRKYYKKKCDPCRNGNHTSCNGTLVRSGEICPCCGAATQDERKVIEDRGRERVKKVEKNKHDSYQQFFLDRLEKMADGKDNREFLPQTDDDVLHWAKEIGITPIWVRRLTAEYLENCC